MVIPSHIEIAIDDTAIIIADIESVSSTGSVMVSTRITTAGNKLSGALTLR